MKWSQAGYPRRSSKAHMYGNGSLWLIWVPGPDPLIWDRIPLVCVKRQVGRMLILVWSLSLRFSFASKGLCVLFCFCHFPSSFWLTRLILETGLRASTGKRERTQTPGSTLAHAHTEAALLPCLTGPSPQARAAKTGRGQVGLMARAWNCGWQWFMPSLSLRVVSVAQ